MEKEKYINLANAIKLCGSSPNVDQCKQCAYYAGADMNKCIPRMSQDIHDGIFDLIQKVFLLSKQNEDLTRELNELAKAHDALSLELAKEKQRADRAEKENESREEASFREHAETHYWRDRARELEKENKKLEQALDSWFVPDGVE